MSNQHRILLVISLAALLLAGCQTAREMATPTPIPTPPEPQRQTYTVQRGTVERVLTFTARVSPVNEVKLFFKTSGYVKSVYFAREEAVKKGDLIAELENEALLNQLAQARVTLEKAELSLTAAEEALARQLMEVKIGLEVKRLKLEKTKAQDPKWSVAAAKARVSEAEADVRDAQAAYDRISWQPGIEASAAARRLQAATTALEIAKANYQIALQNQAAYQYDIKMLEKDIELAEMQLKWLERGVDPNLVKAVEQAQLGVQRLEDQLATARIISPMDGIISTMSLREGSSVQAFDPVVVVSNLDEVEITAQLPDSAMSELKVGMPVTVTLSSFPGKEWRGTIKEMPYPYGTGGSLENLDKEDPYTHIALDDPTVEMKAGDVAKVSVLLERSENTLVLPPSAIRTFEGRSFVVVQEGDRQRRLDVKLGIKSENLVEILEGVEEGQVVIGQ